MISGHYAKSTLRSVSFGNFYKKNITNGFGGLQPLSRFKTYWRPLVLCVYSELFKCQLVPQLHWSSEINHFVDVSPRVSLNSLVNLKGVGVWIYRDIASKSMGFYTKCSISGLRRSCGINWHSNSSE